MPVSNDLRLQELRAAAWRAATGRTGREEDPRPLRYKTARTFNGTRRVLASADWAYQLRGRYVQFHGKRIGGPVTNRADAEKIVTEHQAMITSHNTFAAKAVIG
jgi:hypothetical protein